MKNKAKNIIKDIYRYLKSPNIHNPKIREYPKSILFVCKGNICRSPFAEHMANKIALERSIEKMSLFSAGLEVSVPLNSPIEVLEIAEKFGVKLNDHKSRSITSDMAESFDMIIAMEAWHVKCLQEMFPNLREKMYLLSLFEKNKKSRLWSYHRNNIADPYGKSLFHFIECFQRIERCLNDLYSQIQKNQVGTSICRTSPPP